MSEPLIYPHREALDGQRLQDMLAGTPLQRARAIVAAARTGLLDAQVMLGQILLQGDGIQRDPELAVIWFRITAARGHPMAHNMLGRCYEDGTGVTADPAEAFVWSQRSAEAGALRGQYHL